jgi:protein-tyrosine phosphatase
MDTTTTPVAEAPAHAAQHPRALPLRGTINLRDVGGYTTVDGRRLRWRTLLRSGALHGLDDTGRAVLAQLGLRTVVDLREDDEVAHDPDRLGRLTAQRRQIPIFGLPATRPAAGDDPAAVLAGAATDLEAARVAGARGDLRGIYDHIVDDLGERLAAAVLALAAPSALPAIVHCSAGKDRTGLVVALVLDLAGVPTEVIAQDFALTSLFLRDEGGAALRWISARTAGDQAGLSDGLLASPPELIVHALERVRSRHGDSLGYLLAHGATPHALDRLVNALVVPDAGSPRGPVNAS